MNLLAAVLQPMQRAEQGGKGAAVGALLPSPTPALLLGF